MSGSVEGMLTRIEAAGLLVDSAREMRGGGWIVILQRRDGRAQGIALLGRGETLSRALAAALLEFAPSKKQLADLL